VTTHQPSYLSVFLTFVRNSLVRDMTFRSNFVIETVSSMSWVGMNLGFYLLIFNYIAQFGRNTGWGRYEFFVFLATAMFVNSIVQAFFMPNAARFNEMIRTGGLDFALLKPIDTQFLISLERVSWSQLGNMFVAAGLLAFSLWKLTTRPTDPLELSWVTLLLYPVYVLCGVAIMYSLMIALASTSIWLGRNQHLYNFWFYITNFSRYPMEIYNVSWGVPLLFFFTFAVPILVVVNVPARLLAQPLNPRAAWEWPLAGFALLATVASLVLSRLIFVRALASYRSASS
jgi:ABC-2 type transport system permease protein